MININLTNEKGNTTVLVVVLLPILILLIGWSVDVGRILSAKAELYKGTDIAAREVVKQIDVSQASLSGTQTRVDIEANAYRQVQSNLQGLNGGNLESVEVREEPGYIYIESQAMIPLYFSALAGKRSISISVSGMGRLRRIR